MMIKRFCVTVFVFAAVLADTVCADAVMGNEFFYNNASKMQRLKRTTGFIVNSPNGYVIPQQKPGEAKDSTSWPGGRKDVLPIFKNGAMLFIESVYIHAGKYWGVMPSSHSYAWPGWVPMDHLLVYIGIDFETDNKHKFHKYTGSYDAIISAEKVVLWKWPGSDREKTTVNGREYLTKSLSDNQNNTYRDKEGREWGKVDYWIDHRYNIAGWICLSDPENKSKIPAFNPAPKPAKWSPDDIIEKK